MKNTELRSRTITFNLKEDRTLKDVTLEEIHKEVINLAQFVYKQRLNVDDVLAFKGEVYHALSQLNIKLLTYREKHGYSMDDPS